MLFSLEVKSADSVEGADEKRRAVVAAGKSQLDREAEVEKTFTEIFRPRKRLNGEWSRSMVSIRDGVMVTFGLQVYIHPAVPPTSCHLLYPLPTP